MVTQWLLISLIISICLILFFAGTEIAFLSANKLNIQLKKQQGAYGSKVLGRFLRYPHEALATGAAGFAISLIAYTLFISRFVEPVIMKLLEKARIQNDTLFLILALLFDTILATIIILVIAELLPKAIFKKKANSILTILSAPLQLSYWLLYPVMKLFIEISEFTLKYLFNVRIREGKDAFQKLDLENFVKQSLAGAEEQDESLKQGMFENTMRLLNVRVRNCMIPRNEIIAIEKNQDLNTLKQLFIHTQLSRIPVYEKTIDQIVGYVHQNSMLQSPISIEDIMYEIPALPTSMNLLSVMELLNKQEKNIAWIVDEYGGTAGIISMEDILEEIFGEIHDEYDDKELVEQQLAENVYLFSGRLELIQLNQKYNLDFPMDSHSETLSGYIVQHLGKIPQLNEKLIIGNIEFEILLVTDTRIETVKVKSLIS